MTLVARLKTASVFGDRKISGAGGRVASDLEPAMAGTDFKGAEAIGISV